MISIDQKTNFFEARVSSYSLANEIVTEDISDF
jgi:ribonucleotide reductase beta subunit family protein with ferritin-like domain